MLLFKYLRDPAMLTIIPETKKKENRKVFLKRKAVDKFCQTRDEILGVEETNFEDMIELIVLEEFEHSVDIDGTMVPSLGLSHHELCFALFSLLSEIKVLIWSCQLMVLIVSILVDGHLVIVEESLSNESQQASFSSSDHGYICLSGLRRTNECFFVLLKYAKECFDADVRVRRASIDHADAIASALASVWPHIEILTCWEHLFRQPCKQTKSEKKKGFKKDIGEQHLRLLHLTRSLKQFRAISERVV
ncbi:LOW QUALITY PROTEIN: hypothetical protein PHMEG_00013580 [Phytophthora megakarya]|uniref:MULE transposase domain-containing protein n=1 Tax=Phytophthora megakarya TaxID=4795 RepID=A0A225W6Y6_9STRA|nr:LOW QUALITY PROTEIN: hypothetical protein PHMEG_00013580 [Phytophthora megakarya]